MLEMHELSLSSGRLIRAIHIGLLHATEKAKLHKLSCRPTILQIADSSLQNGWIKAPHRWPDPVRG